MTVVARSMSGAQVGNHVGVQEALADPDDRVGQRRGVQAGVEAAAIAFEIDEFLKGAGHTPVHGAAGPGQQAQRGLRVRFEECPQRAVPGDRAEHAAGHRDQPLGARQPRAGLHLLHEQAAGPPPEQLVEQLLRLPARRYSVARAMPRRRASDRMSSRCPATNVSTAAAKIPAGIPAGTAAPAGSTTWASPVLVKAGLVMVRAGHWRCASRPSRPAEPAHRSGSRPGCRGRGPARGS